MSCQDANLASSKSRQRKGRFGLPRLLQIFGEISAASRQRRALAAMEDLRLCDLGLTRKEADIESARPIWDVHPSWRL